MDARVFALLDGLTDFLGISGIFLICFALSFISFLVCLLLTLIKSEYSVKNRLWLVVSVGFVLIIDLAFTIYLRATALFLLILFATDVLFVGVLLLLPKKQGVYSKESLSLAGLLNKKARESEDAYKACDDRKNSCGRWGNKSALSAREFGKERRKNRTGFGA